MGEDGSSTVVRGGALAEAYRALAQSTRFQRFSGADFVFYDSHAGMRGAAGIPLDEILCKDFYNSTILTTVQRNSSAATPDKSPIPLLLANQSSN